MQCNSVRSQPFDRAYDAFAQYIIGHESDILDEGVIQWSTIFSSDWQGKRDDVTRYWVKHIGCRLADGGILVSKGIVDFLDGALGPKHLNIELEICSDIVAVARHLREAHDEEFGSFWMGDLVGDFSRSRQLVNRAHSFLGIRWLRMNYWYDLDDEAGSTNFEQDIVQLPYGYSVDPAEVPGRCLACHPTE